LNEVLAQISHQSIFYKSLVPHFSLAKSSIISVRSSCQFRYTEDWMLQDSSGPWCSTNGSSRHMSCSDSYSSEITTCIRRAIATFGKI